MRVQYHVWRSPNLKRDMEMKTYGTRGRPLLVFPTSRGRFFDYENFGMIEALAPMVEEGKLHVFAVDSTDGEHWLAEDLPPERRGRNYVRYEAYVLGEVLPMIRQNSATAPDRLILTGCSFGGYHAVNLYLKHPDLFRTAISLSGVFDLDFAVGDYTDDLVYFNDPLKYLPRLKDEAILNVIRDGRLILCAGQGENEQWHVRDGQALSHVLVDKSIPHWFDLWGFDVYHDWVWWQKQIVYFLDHVL